MDTYGLLTQSNGQEFAKQKEQLAESFLQMISMSFEGL